MGLLEDFENELTFWKRKRSHYVSKGCYGLVTEMNMLDLMIERLEKLKEKHLI